MFLDPKFHGKLMIITLASLFLFFITPNNVLAHEWMAPKEKAKEKNPVEMNQNSVQLGEKSYSGNCAYCHGNNAEGNDSKYIGLKTNPPNLKKRIKSHSDGDFFWKIQNGRGKMPAFKNELKTKEIWNIVNYLRNLVN